MDQLATISGNKGNKMCCMFYEGHEISKTIYGFARLIQYIDSTGSKP
jgi:hypothetical protein